MSLLGTAALAVGICALVFGDETPLIALDRDAAIAAVAFGAVIELIATRRLTRQQKRSAVGRR